MKQDDVFASREVFAKMFNEGLVNLLSEAKLNAFILVCANATFDAALKSMTGGMLQKQFQSHRDRLYGLFAKGRSAGDSDDDTLVFLKLCSIGLEQLKNAEHKSVEEWDVQFNHIRSFRPKRAAEKPVKGISEPFNPDGFNFNKDFLQKECFWRGEYLGNSLCLFYNKYPFVDSHSLLVPDAGKQLNQFLREKHHRYVWSLVEEVSPRVPGLGFGYNSYGAFASVNHLHFQMFIRDRDLPVELPCWKHHGGTKNYPARCMVFTSERDSWAYIEKLHEREVAYNLLYVPGMMYCFPRKNQGTYKQSEWTSGFAWYEMSGGMITFNREDYDKLTSPSIAQEFSSLSVDIGI